MSDTRPWQDVLLGSADQLDPSVISHTMDEGLIAGLRKWLDAESAWDATLPDGTPASERVRPSRPGMHPLVTFHTTRFIEEKVAQYGTRLGRTRAQRERAEEYAPDDYDPTDRELGGLAAAWAQSLGRGR